MRAPDQIGERGNFLLFSKAGGGAETPLPPFAHVSLRGGDKPWICQDNLPLLFVREARGGKRGGKTISRTHTAVCQIFFFSPPPLFFSYVRSRRVCVRDPWSVRFFGAYSFPCAYIFGFPRPEFKALSTQKAAAFAERDAFAFPRLWQDVIPPIPISHTHGCVHGRTFYCSHPGIPLFKYLPTVLCAISFSDLRLAAAKTNLCRANSMHCKEERIKGLRRSVRVLYKFFYCSFFTLFPFFFFSLGNNVFTLYIDT